MDVRRKFGNVGEAMAARYLESRGYRILARQWKQSFGELDLVAEHDGVLVCIEVKSRKSDAYGNPEEAVNGAKLQKLFMLAEAYRTQAHWHGPIRVDVVAILLSEPPVIRHLQAVA